VSTPTPVRILVADDFAVVREGVKALLERQADLRVTAFAVDGREAVEKATTVPVDLAILDIAMPRLTGL
jgi:YesN/AraC family two-component response regulator